MNSSDRESTLPLDPFFESATTGMLLVDRAGRILRVNPALAQLLGYARREMVDRHILEFISEQDDTGTHHQIRELLQAGRYRFRGEVAWTCRDGRVLTTWFSAALPAGQPESESRILALVENFSRHGRLDQHLATLTFYNRFTGLPNRLLLKDRLEHALLRAVCDRSRLALLRLKLHGGTSGRPLSGPFGTQSLLVEMVGRLNSCIRQGDTIAHLANGEFALLLENIANAAEPAIVVRKIDRQLKIPLSLEEKGVRLHASIGVAVFPEDGGETEVLLKNAASARQRSERPGRSTCRFFNREVNLQVLREERSRHRLEQAVNRRELEVHFQPLGDPAVRQVTAVEALLRWRHPQKGLILPADFLPQLEETGLIDTVDDWVLRQACLQVKEWRAAVLPQLRLAVNLSPRQLDRPDFRSQVRTILAESGLEPAALTLEIIAGEPLDPVRTGTLEELAALGVKIGLDDLGTGAVSLAQLGQVPLHSIKIDRRLIRGIPYCREDAAITVALITLAGNLGVGVAAKGVETREQLAFLHAHRCRDIQGNFFAKPMPAEEFGGWIKTALPA